MGLRAAALPRGFHGWRIVAVLALTETVSWGVLYYAFAVFQVPMHWPRSAPTSWDWLSARATDKPMSTT